MIVEKMMNTAIQGHTFTKKIGQTVYVVRYHFNEDAKETMQEKINRMLVTEASQTPCRSSLPRDSKPLRFG